MRDILEEKLARFEFLEKQMSDPDVLSNSSMMANVAREHGSLARLAGRYRTFKNIVGEIEDAREMIDGDDAEMAELAEADLIELKAKREKVWHDLLDMTIGGEDANRDKIVLEIRGGTGGDEAALFARDLYEMYKRYAESKGWKYEIMESNPTELGGFKEAIISVSGEGVYREMQYESGGHRVQRVPETETKGRVHTSAATVAVMPEPEEVEFELNDADFTVERYAASSGPGGQHVNKTASAVRLIHQETGIIVQCCEERSQHKNFDRALRLLKTKLYDAQRAREAKERADHRKSLVGSGDRSQRIRTYNFPENRITDHRINLTLYKLDQVMAGQLQPVIDALIDHDREELRGSMGDLD
ncbi:peptide chain release factor 1 [Bremerella cremea]|uniref:peptide chain release factor 1 n=1 Tax=Bremerella cremea TaxID=1031537 RepID=UPI0031E96C3F